MFKLTLSPVQPTPSSAADAPVDTADASRQAVVEHRDPTPKRRVPVPAFLRQGSSDTEIAIAEEAARRGKQKRLTR